jgi:hypothetical protein
VSRRRDDLTDEDGIDGPLERRERAALRAATGRRHMDIPAVTQADIDAALAPARAAEAAAAAANEYLARVARYIAAASCPPACASCDGPTVGGRCTRCDEPLLTGHLPTTGRR